MKMHEGSGGTAPLILNLGTRGRWVDTFVFWPLYAWGKKLQFPLEAGWAPESVWTWWQREKFSAPAGNQTWSCSP